MAEGINVGSAEVSVVPNAEGFSAKLSAQIDPQAQAIGDKLAKTLGDRISDGVAKGVRDGLSNAGLTASQQGSKQGDDFGKSFNARVTAALKTLPKAKIDADSTEADRKLDDIRARLELLSQQRIGVDVDADEALVELAALKGELADLDGSYSVRVNADVASAVAQLAAVKAEADEIAASSPSIKVDADTAEADAQLAATSAAATGVGDAAESAGGGFSGLIAAGVAVGPALIPVLAAVAAAAIALLSVLGPVLVAAGVVGLAVSAVAGGVKDLDASQKKATSSGASLANQQLGQAGAARQVQQAEASLANTRANAADAAVRSAEAVKNAKQAEAQAAVTAAQNTKAAEAGLATASANITTAKQAELAAENALTDARATAAQQAQDLANQVIDGQLAQRQAVLDVSGAQTNLNTVSADPTATDAAKQQAQLQFDQAQQHLSELTTANQRLADQKAAADKAGIEGSQVVTQAQSALQAATDGVTKAQQAQVAAAKNLTQVQLTGAQNVAKAQQSVTDALRSQVTQQRQSAASIAQAVNSVASAQESLARSNISAGGGASGISKQASAFALLSPQVQAFAHFVHDNLEPDFKKIQDAAAKGFLPGVEGGLKALQPILPGVAEFVGKVAKALGDMFENGAKALKDPFWSSFFGFAEKTVIPVLKGVAQFVGDIVGGFAGLVQASAPLTGSVLSNVLGLADGFKNFGEQAGTPGSPFQTFIGYVQQYGPIVADFFGNLFEIVGNLVVALQPFGDLLLIVFDDITNLIVAIGPEGLAIAMAAVGAAVLIAGAAIEELVLPISVVVVAIAGLAAGAVYLYTSVKPVHDFINEHFLPLFRELADYFTSTVLPILKKIGGEALDGIKDGIAHVAQAISDHKPELDELYGTFKQAAEYIVQHVLPVLGPILKAGFETAGNYVSTFIGVVSGIVDAFDKIAPYIVTVMNDVSTAMVAGVNIVIDAINFLIRSLDAIPGVKIPTIAHVGPAAQIGDITHGPPSGVGSATGGGHRLASGGVLPGYAPGVDSVRALLSPGEAVMVPEFVQMVGPDWVYAMNAYASRGRGAGGNGRYAGGGIIGDIGSGISSIGDAITFNAFSGAEHAAIGAAIGSAKAFANRTIPAGFFRDMADGTLDRIGSDLKFSGGGIVGSPWASMLGGGSVRGSHLSVVPGGAVHNELTVVNNHQPATPAMVVTALNQHAALHQGPIFAGAGIPGF